MNKSILIVDDDEDIVKLQTGLLHSLGFRNVVSAEDGFQALHFMAEIQPDLVFLDIMMPGLDGWLICEIINRVERWQHIPVILQSALEGSDNIRRGIRLGAHGYLEKPLTKSGLSALIDGVFGEDVLFPPNLNPNVEPVLVQTTEAAQQTFNLILGQQVEVNRVSVFHDAGSAPIYWDYLGEVHSHGVIDMALYAGWNLGFGTAVASSLHAIESEDVTDENRLEALRDVLQITVSTVARALSHVAPNKPAEPTAKLSSPLPETARGQNSFMIELGVGEQECELILTVDV